MPDKFAEIKPVKINVNELPPVEFGGKKNKNLILANTNDISMQL